eukprot:3094441-Rhodomonas_salina.1
MACFSAKRSRSQLKVSPQTTPGSSALSTVLLAETKLLGGEDGQDSVARTSFGPGHTDGECCRNLVASNCRARLRLLRPQPRGVSPEEFCHYKEARQ